MRTYVLCAVVFFLVLFSVVIRPCYTEEGTGFLPAFPGAEGYGAASKGGRGGRVLKVTTLDPKGPGSLQWACSQDGPRIIVFDVSGVITPPNYSKDGKWLSIRKGNITIAGQTAPGAGITIDGMVSFYRPCYSLPREKRVDRKAVVPDVILRFLRIRPTQGKGNLRTLEASKCRRFIADHVSGSWALDQAFNVGHNTENLTYQWCGIEETDIGLEGTQPHSFGLFGSYNKTGNTSVHHCLLAHHMGRAPCFDECYRVDFRNNLLYNIGFGEPYMRYINRSRTPNRPYALFNLVCNTWRVGPGGIMGTRAIFAPLLASRQGLLPADRRGRFWFRGNRFDWEGIAGMERYSGGRAKYAAEKPYSMAPVNTHTADEAYELVCAHGGCLPRDSVSARTIAEVRTRTGEFGRHGPDAGLMEGLAPGKPPVDTDNDGMPDSWEKKHSLDPGDPNDSSKIVPAGASPGDRHKGYTYIEYYINECADRRIAEALTEYRLDTEPAKPWDRPAAGLAPQRERYKSLDEIVKAVKEQNAEMQKDDRRKRYISLGWYAVQQLSRMGAKAAPAVPELSEGLSRGLEDPRAVAFSAWALGAIGPAAKGAVPELIKALKSKQSTESGKYKFRPRGFIAWALGRIGMNEAQAGEAVPVLAGLINGEDVFAQPAAAWTLSRLGPLSEPAMPELLKALGKSTYSHLVVGFHASNALANIGKPAVPGLVKAAVKGNGAARNDAIRALGLIGSEARDAVPVLIERLSKDTSGVVRGRIALALARIAPGNKKTMEALASALSDSFMDVRVSAAIALGDCGHTAGSSVPALQKALSDQEREVKRAAALALGRIGKPALPALKQALAGNDPYVRKYAARAFGDMGKEAAGAVDDLVKALSDRNAEVRREAVWSLALIGASDKPAASALKKAGQNDSDWVVRYAAMQAMKEEEK